MIGYLHGEITIIDPTLLLMDVGGVGYEVKVSLNTYSKLKDLKTGKVFTYLHVNQAFFMPYYYFFPNLLILK